MDWSDLTVVGGSIDTNIAGRSGGGVMAISLSTVSLREGANVSNNTAARGGGGLFVQASTLNVSDSGIYLNGAGGDGGGGVLAETKSIVTLGDRTSISHNTARGNGGGLGLLESSSLATDGRVTIYGNAARGSSIGAGLAALTSTVRLGAGETDLSYNSAASDGGAIALVEGSSLTDSGDPARACFLTVRHNTASGNGGGVAVSGDSSFSLVVSTAVFERNEAAKQGGGLFIGSAQTEFSASQAMEYKVSRATMWRLDLVDNLAPAGDGGGVRMNQRMLMAGTCHLL